MFEIPSELHGQAERRLREEYFVWLTTVGTDLTPQPRPVWFLWEPASSTFLIYSQPDARKVKHIEKHPRVALHFNADATGDNSVLVFIGTARIDTAAPPPNEMSAYMEKYRQGITDINMTPESFTRGYSVAIRVAPSAVRGW